MKRELPRGKDLPYWRTSSSSPDTWSGRVRKLLSTHGAALHREGFISEEDGGAAFMFEFTLGGDRFRIVWPVCKSDEPEVAAAIRQAITMAYHDVKARIVSAKVLGARRAFLDWWILPNGRTAGDAAMEIPAPDVFNALSAPEVIP